MVARNGCKIAARKLPDLSAEVHVVFPLLMRAIHLIGIQLFLLFGSMKPRVPPRSDQRTLR